ncbi:MAG: hypothetical protein PUJ84_00405 [Mollicutes bacterium]|nr:hypothetical protein [Mollicutes bacterium]
MNKELKVQLRGGFSDRRKINPLNTEMQTNDLDERTRNKIANLFKDWCDEIIRRGLECYFYKRYLNDVFGQFVDDQMKYKFKYDHSETFDEYILIPIVQDNCSDVLTICEYITGLASSILENPQDQFLYYNENHQIDCEQELNALFEEEFVGYRMVGHEITPITNEVEIDEIKTSLDIEFEGCKSHIKKGLSLLSDREKPDYKNSIKESISAVESICQIICKDDKATLGKALNKLEESGIKLHKSLKEAFSKLYGYTSDEGGIRHAEGLFESNVSFEDAKFCLVSCCAFVNYLISTCKGMVGENDE